MKKRFLSALLSFYMLLTLLPMGLAASQDDFVMDTDGVLTKYNGSGGDVVIPDGVTAIGEKAFFECETLTSVIIPDGVTSIGGYAFQDCHSLASVVIPESVTSIGCYAFDDCRSLAGVVIPESVTSIGYYAFQDCDSLTSVVIPAGVANIEEGAFFGCNNLTSVVIPNGVTGIGLWAFASCTALTDITIPGSVTKIEGNAFEFCESLANLTIQNGVVSIGGGAFQACYSLTSVIIPGSVQEISGSVFAYCESLTDITVTPDNPFYYDLDGVLYAADGTLVCHPAGKEATSYIIPEGTPAIGDCAFYYCTALTSVTIPDSVTSIGSEAFERCTALTDITIPDSVTSIGNSAFYGCDSLTDVVIPSGVTSMGFSTFSHCDKLARVVIPESVTWIKSYAFSNCTALSDVTISEGVTLIYDSAFSRCSALTNVTIPKSVNRISYSAFSDCTSLESVTVLARDVDFYEYNQVWDEPIFRNCPETMVVYGPSGSTTQTYCEKNNITFVPLSEKPGHTHAYGEEWKTDETNHWHECLTCYNEADKAEHSKVIDTPAVPATCTEDGTTEGSHCEVCGYVIAAQTVIPATGHSYSTTLAGDETGHGYKCANCGDFKDAAEHTLVIDIPAVPATCATDGRTEGGHCEVCGYSKVSTVIPATGHSYSANWITNKTMHWKNCEKCGETDWGSIAAHSPVADVAVDATCTEDGATEGSHCEECGYIIKAQTVIPAAGHSYSTTLTGNEAGHGYKCANCGDFKDAAEHTEDEGTVTKEPTEEEAGVKTYACSVCGYVMRTESIPATGGSVLGGLAWSIDATGKLTLAGEFPNDGAIWVASWSSEGRFLSAQVLTAQRRTVQLEPDWKSLKLMWLNGNFAPQCAAVTIEK